MYIIINKIWIKLIGIERNLGSLTLAKGVLYLRFTCMIRFLPPCPSISEVPLVLI